MGLRCLEARGLDGATLGFHARARYMVDRDTQRMFANLARLDLETTDMEFNRALMGLRDDSMQQLEAAASFQGCSAPQKTPLASSNVHCR